MRKIFKYHSLYQFQEEAPNFKGLLVLSNGFFVDEKLIQTLEDLGEDYYVINYDNIESNFLNFLKPGLGPNLFKFWNGQIVKKLTSLVTEEKLATWLSE